MSLGPREAAAFLVDCSESMRETCEFVEGTGPDQRTITTTPIELMIRYVKAKIAQRIMRDLKTTPCCVISFPVSKTKNVLTQQMKDRDGAEYDGENDNFRHFYEAVAFDFTPNASMISTVSGLKNAKTGSSPADLHSALILGLETIDNQPKANKFKKDIYILTNGEAKSDWTRWEDTQARLNDKGVSVVVIGMGFDDEEAGFFDENKSENKHEQRENEEILHKLVGGLEVSSVVATTASALEAIAEPNVKETKSMSTGTILTFGNRETFPDTSLTMHIEVKKAITAAPMKSMKQMSMRHFERTATTQRPSANQDPSQSQAGEPSHKTTVGLLLDRMLLENGLTLKDEPNADIALHTVLRESMTYYRPSDDPTDKGPGATQNAGADQDEVGGEDSKLRWTGEKELSEAYYYGGDPVTIGDEAGVGKLKGNKTSMEIIGFIKQSAVRFEWRMNDLLYVYGGKGQLGSQQLLSALINAMEEKQCAAITRWVGKGMNRKEVFITPDPKVGLLWPMRGESDEGSPVEYCLWSQLPFAEDVRNLNFPSLTNLYNRKNAPVTVHKNLPTAEMDKAMEAFVDAMDLVTGEAEDEEMKEVKEEGDDEEEAESKPPPSWFSVQDSFSPAIHNIQNTLVFRLSDPDGDLPPPPSALTKYLDPPSFVVENAAEAKAAAIKAFNITRVPPKPKKLGKKVQNFATANDQQVDIDALFGSTAPQKPAPSTSQLPKSFLAPSQTQSKPSVADKHAAMNVDGEEAAAEQKMAPSVSMHVDEEEDPPTEEEDPPTEDDEEMELAPAKIDEQDPLRDFDKIVRSRGAVSAAEEMFAVAEKLVKSSFSTAKYQLAADCLEAVRTGCSEYPATYNYGIRTFVKSLEADPKKKDFKEWIKQKDLGLISTGEGGASQTDASTFIAGL